MRRSIYSLIIGVVFAGVALFLLFTNRPQTEAANADVPVIATTKVMVAAKDIAYGDKIVPDYVRMVDWPEASVPKDAILTRADLLEGPEAPRIALRPMTAGEPYLKSKVSGFGERPILSRKLAEGMRAFTVRINDVSGVGGFILPGDRVDILLTRQLNNSGRDNLATDVILQNVSVLGIDQLSNENTEAPVLGKSATFEVTPEQAQKLALAAQVGTLSLSLRNYAALTEEKTSQIAASDLGEKKASAPAPRSAPAPARDNSLYVRVRKGTEVEQEKVTR
ncbi:MAG: Flp pilus assembly protein CpaB [Hyphomonadaceae bacterium]|nr:Flp pilus assembly protein CpaB [Hyphomonadaceae bacterium]